MIKRSLKSDSISVAKLRLVDFEKEERRKVESRAAVASGKMTFREAMAIFRERLKGEVHLKPVRFGDSRMVSGRAGEPPDETPVEQNP